MAQRPNRKVLLDQYLSGHDDSVEWTYEDAKRYLMRSRLPTGKGWDGHEPIPAATAKLKRARRRSQQRIHRRGKRV